jgi:hypothetical protein
MYDDQVACQLDVHSVRKRYGVRSVLYSTLLTYMPMGHGNMPRGHNKSEGFSLSALQRHLSVCMPSGVFRVT